MSKRRVPAALHEELTEYAALMRALRTQDIMDLTKHITKDSPFTLGDKDVDMDSGSDSSRITGVGSSRSSKSKGKQKATNSSGQKTQLRRDHWTRWPLLLDDVPKPEWTLEDEVAVIANMAMKLNSTAHHPLVANSPEPEDYEDEDELVDVDIAVEEDDPDHAFYVPDLAAIVAGYLSTLLADLASYTAPRPASMQNRIEPLGWRTVIDAVVTCGNPELANPTVVNNVIRRMKALYGTSISSFEDSDATTDRPVKRIRTQNAAKQKLNERLAKAEASLFTQSSPPLYKEPSPLPPTLTKQKRSKLSRKEEKSYVPRVKRTSKARASPPPATEVSEETVEEQAQVLSQEAPRRTGRAKPKVNYRDLAPDDPSMEG